MPQLQALRRIDGAVGAPATIGRLPGEFFFNMGGAAGVGTGVALWAFDGVWWREVSVSVIFANAAEALAGVNTTKSLNSATLQSRIRTAPSGTPANDNGYLFTLDAAGLVPVGFIPAAIMRTADFTPTFLAAVEDEEDGADIITAVFETSLLTMNLAARQAWTDSWLAGILDDSSLLARSDLGEIIGVPMAPITSGTFASYAAGTIDVYPDMRNLTLLDFPTPVTIDVGGVAQISFAGADASLYRVINLTAAAPAAECRITALGDAQHYLKGKTFYLEFVNTNGGAKTITFDAETGDASLLPEDFALEDAIGTAVGDRVVVEALIANDSSVLYRRADNYGSGGGGPTPLAPAYVDSFSYYANAGSTTANFHLTLPATALAGDMAVLTIPQVAASLTALGYGTVKEAITRFNSTVGSNYGVSCYSHVLTPTDIANGYLNIPSLTNVTAVGVDIFRNVDTVTHVESYTRSGGLSANSITLESEEADYDNALALAIVVRGGGLRTPTYPAGWSARINRSDPTTAGVGRISLHTMTMGLGLAGSVSPADSFVIAGAADMQLTTFTLLLEKAP